VYFPQTTASDVQGKEAYRIKGREEGRLTKKDVNRVELGRWGRAVKGCEYKSSTAAESESAVRAAAVTTTFLTLPSCAPTPNL
jgi:hypothetical protein